MRRGGRGGGASGAVPVADGTEEFRRVRYLLEMSARGFALADVSVWQLGSTGLAVAFERRARGLQTLPCWLPARRLGEENALDRLAAQGFSLGGKGGLTFSSGDLDLDPHEGTAHRFLLCQVAVGRAFVVDDPSEQAEVPEGYDSLYLALSTSIDGSPHGDGGFGYRHDYTIMDPQQALPMYLVQFFIDPDGRSSEMEFGAANRMDDQAPASIDKLYDRYDFFDPVLYVPVSVRDKMVGSHSTGENAQHKLIGIGDAYEVAISESLKVDPILASRQEEIKSQLRSVDNKLRDVNRNAAMVEERIYKTLQNALFKLQDITQSKMSALLAEEVELRRQLQQTEWMESFLDLQRESASQVEFLNGWKCHVQLRADAVRNPLRTPAVLEGVKADLDLVGQIQIQSQSQATVQQQQQQRGSSMNGVIGMGTTSQGAASVSGENQSHASSRNREPQQDNIMRMMQAFNDQGQARAMAQQQPDVGQRSVRAIFPGNAAAAAAAAAPSSSEEKKEEAVAEEEAKLVRAPEPPKPMSLTFMSEKTPAKFAQFSLRAEAVRRLRQLNYDNRDSIKFAKNAFQESKLLEHCNINEEFTKLRKEEEEDEEDEDDDLEDDAESIRKSRARRDRDRKKEKKENKPPRVFDEAEALLLCLPFNNCRTPPKTKLVYATWKAVKKDVPAIVGSIPQKMNEFYDSEDEADENHPALPKYVPEAMRTVVVVRANGRVFGGFCDESWRTDGHTFGSADCFLFSSTLDVKIPFVGRQVLSPPPAQDYMDIRHIDEEDMTGLRKFASCQSDKRKMQFGLSDLVLRDDLKSCSSRIESTFGLGLPKQSEETKTFLAGAETFKVDEVELWEIDFDARKQ